MIYPNWIMDLKATACLCCHCIDNWLVKHRMDISQIAEVRAMWTQIAAPYYTTGQDFTFLTPRMRAYFLPDDPYH